MGNVVMDSKELIPPGLAYLADNIKSKDNILGASKADGAKWAKGLDIPKEGRDQHLKKRCAEAGTACLSCLTLPLLETAVFPHLVFQSLLFSLLVILIGNPFSK